MRYLYLLIILLHTINSNAQYSYKVFHINSIEGKGADPQNLTVYKGKVYFFADDSTHGRELMVCDGNTVQSVFDSRKGPKSGALVMTYDRYKHIALANNNLYFVGVDTFTADSSDVHIYEYNATSTPTAIYTRRVPGTPAPVNLHTYITQMTSANGLLFFDTGTVKHGINIYNPATKSFKVANTVVYGPIPFSYLIPFNKQIFTGGVYTNRYDIIADTAYRVGNNGARFGFWDTANGNLYFKSPTGHIYEYNSVQDTAKRISQSSIGYAYNALEYERSFAIIQNKVYYPARKNTFKKHMQYYDLSAQQHGPEIKLMNDTTVEGMVVYKNKLYYYNHPDFIVDDLNGNRQKLNQWGFKFFRGTQAVINNGWLYATAQVIDPNTQKTTVELVAIYDSTTSINRLAKQKVTITPYPNPTNGNAYLDVTLEQPTSFVIQLTDMNGRVVYLNEPQLYSKGKHKITIPIQQLRAGTYLFSIVDNNGTLLNSGRLVKQ